MFVVSLIKGSRKEKGILSLLLVLSLAIPFFVFAGLIEPGNATDHKAAAYTNVQIAETSDGTGHGTPSQTFINSDNGYKVGDNTPTDGVVSSGDYVTVKTKLSFTAAKERTIRVSADTSSAPFLQLVATGGWCESGRIVTAKLNSDNSCSYKIPTGAVETLTTPMVFKALDTSGKIQKDQKLSITVERSGLSDSMSSYPVRPFTVVSAPLADVVLDNGG